ncbi:MAG: hypothetical protein J7545_21290 [Roseofilum sp. SBFL]|uniref:hypothetical protein n=1 Tax=Roseofilum sp. SID1 TaxID=2821497 RepID=UPI001B249D68|nr:hypothetical protein [Roseofilum sp. SID1]MBP0015650.1 hypothetical protein [Roseofilum sp. SID3]MBP0022565.1 hypothetical protein [Roseofilum sp. SID2]MBP0044475.1 hypothetical protein [Roseofilum sp. SBFL]
MQSSKKASIFLHQLQIDGSSLLLSTELGDFSTASDRSNATPSSLSHSKLPCIHSLSKDRVFGG